MNRPSVAILFGFIGLIAITAPIVIAIQQSIKSSEEAEMAYILSYAKDVLKRSDITGDQATYALNKLTELDPKDPCSDESIEVMREIALTSSYLQSVGFVSKDHMICSSHGGKGFDLYLGPVDFTNARNRKFRNNVKLPSDTKTTYIAIELNGYVAIISKDLPIDATIVDEDISLATFLLGQKITTTSRGVIKPEWIELLKDNQQITLLSNGYIVAIVKSKKYLIASLAALPISHLKERTLSTALILVPVGLIAGLILAFIVYFFSKLQLEMSTAMKVGLKRNEFYLVYQPIVNLQTGKWVGMEALMRWKRATGEMVRPDLFISYAEESGLIKLITKRLLKLVAEDTKNFFERYPDFYLSINLSSADLHSRDIVEQISSLIDKINASPKNLIVEVTERGFINTDLARATVEEIRAIGVPVAIDDFGTGYSSLSYLETFKADFLKIDKLFVDTVGTNFLTSHVILHIIKLAKALDLKMVAEGVELESQAQSLRDLGVQFAQGWLYAKPMVFSEILKGMSNTKEPTQRA